ncbi:SdpI family protein [Jiangella alba]|uniref:SdpI/YhfL protein family protein n=1 Tax=Jiangella alba TaxID=561176 RepID=A0A1H5MT10_9ACTN|nr:SdpI family protein [Jiangella alba]SEE91508.1 SdpI/YhfL protein family protein [Jiangella alba]
MELFGVRLLLAAIVAASGAAIVWMARATASGRLRRNYWAGIRTQATLASDDAWLAAHRAARPATEAGGWAAVVAALAVFVVPADPEGLLAVPVLAGVGVLLVLVLVGARRGVVAARSVGDDAPLR